MEIRLDDWDKLPTQLDFYDDFRTKLLTYSAGLGAGKTHVLCRKALKLSALNQGHPGGFLCPSFTDFRRDVKPELELILEDDLGLVKGKHWWYHGSHYEYRFCWNKKPLYILSGEKPIAGPNLAYCLINEFSSIKFERIKEMFRRVRVKEAPYRQRCMAGTPEDVYGWLEEFVEQQEEAAKKDPDEFRILYADTRENTYVDPDYRKHLESMLDAQSLKVFASGQIVRLTGNYFYYAFSRDKHVTDLYDRDENERIYIGLDFNVGQMAAVVCHKIGDKTHYFDEIHLKGNSGTPEMATAISEQYGTDVSIIIDASGKSRKTSGMSDLQILQKVFPRENIKFKRQNPRFRARQLLINGRLEHGKITFHPRMKKTIRDLEKVKQLDNFEKDKSNPDLTHWSDGFDYLEDYEFKLGLERKTRTLKV